MRGKIKQNLHIVLLVVLLILSALYMLYWGTQKRGFHVDEMYSLMDMSGNVPRRARDTVDFYNTWHDASGLYRAVSVSRDNAFSYNVKNNAFFILLHTAYSFYPDVFSIWPAIILNIVFYIGTLIVLYMLTLILIDNKYLALLPCLLWGISNAAIEVVVNIRMYTMLVFFSTLITYLIFITINQNHRKWKFWVYSSLIVGLLLGY